MGMRNCEIVQQIKYLPGYPDSWKETLDEKLKFDFNITPADPKPIIRDILEKNVSEKYTLSDKLWRYLQDYAAKHKAAGNGLD